MQPSIIGRDMCPKCVKSPLFGSIKGLPKEAVSTKTSSKSVSSWDTLWLGLPAKKGVSHVKLNPQFAAGTRGSHRDAINPSKVGNATVSAHLAGVKNQFLLLREQFKPIFAHHNFLKAHSMIYYL
jgi:hypothetical protein